MNPDGFKVTITDGVEKQVGFLADFDPLVVEDGIRFACVIRVYTNAMLLPGRVPGYEDMDVLIIILL